MPFASCIVLATLLPGLSRSSSSECLIASSVVVELAMHSLSNTHSPAPFNFIAIGSKSACPLSQKLETMHVDHALMDVCFCFIECALLITTMATTTVAGSVRVYAVPVFILISALLSILF